MSTSERCPQCGCDLAEARRRRAVLEGEMFRERRKARGLTLRETARRAAISAAYLSDIESAVVAGRSRYSVV